MKIPASVKIIAFIVSVVCLSWFFAGYRAVCQAPTITNLGLLLACTLLTIFTLGVQGWWIYMEEKYKGTLKRKIALFEQIHTWLEKDGKKA